MHTVADAYERILHKRRDHHTGISGKGGAATWTTAATIVRVAHMEISWPSVLDSLRGIHLLTGEGGLSRVVCMPYFLGPSRHASEDVPNQIEDARIALRVEGLLSSRRSKRWRGGRTGGFGAAAAVDNVKEEEEEFDNDNNDDNKDGKIPIQVSNMLGMHLEGMLGTVDNLVKRALNKH